MSWDKRWGNRYPVLGARGEDRLESLVEEIEAAGGAARPRQLDVRQLDW